MFETQKIDTFFSGEKNPFEEEERSFVTRRIKVVRFFKLFLPSLTALLLGVGVALFDFDTTPDNTISLAEDERIYFEKFRIKNTVFEITEKDNQFSVLKADVVEETTPGKKIYSLLNPDAKTTKDFKTWFANLATSLGEAALISDPDFTIKNMVVKIDSANPDRVNYTFPVKMSGNIEIVDGNVPFGQYVG